MPERDEDSVAGVVAGFIVWLADQRFEPGYRYRCPATVEQFLRWQGRRRQQQLPAHLNAYCRELALDGACDAELNDVRGIIEQLDQFLRTTS